MGYLVDGQEQILVGSGPKHVGHRPEFQRPERCASQEVGEDNLERHNAEDDIFGQGLGAA